MNKTKLIVYLLNDDFKSLRIASSSFFLRSARQRSILSLRFFISSSNFLASPSY